MDRRGAQRLISKVFRDRNCQEGLREDLDEVSRILDPTDWLAGLLVTLSIWPHPIPARELASEQN